MEPAPKIGNLSSAVDLIAQPLVLEALQATSEDKALKDVLPAEVDSVTLDAAVQRLAAIGAILLSPAGPSGRHTLTDRGRLLLELLEELEAQIPASRAATRPR